MKKKKHFYNKINSEELKFALANEPFERITASFYKYVDISVPIVSPIAESFPCK